MAVDVVLVDLDGTVWDGAPWYATLLAPDDGADHMRLTSGLRDAAGGLRAASLLKARYTPARFAQASRANAAQLHMYDSARETLEQLADDAALGVVTSLPAWMARPMLEALELTQLFDVIQTAQWRVPAKPHPAALNRALASLGHTNRGATYIGDSKTDADAATRAGMSFIGAGWGYGALEGPHVVDQWPAVRDAL